MADIQKKPVGIMETVLRDAHQSLIATRMPTEKMLPIIDTMDKVNFLTYPSVTPSIMEARFALSVP